VIPKAGSPSPCDYEAGDAISQRWPSRASLGRTIVFLGDKGKADTKIRLSFGTGQRRYWWSVRERRRPDKVLVVCQDAPETYDEGIGIDGKVGEFVLCALAVQRRSTTLSALVREGEHWTYFCGVQPLFRHHGEDRKTFQGHALRQEQ